MDVQEAYQAEETVPRGRGLSVNIQVHGRCGLGRVRGSPRRPQLPNAEQRNPKGHNRWGSGRKSGQMEARGEMRASG